MLKLKQPDLEVKDADLLEAVSIRFCRHFPAMNIAHALGGSKSIPSIPWTILEQYKPAEILAEIVERNIDISNLEVAMASCECCPRLVVNSALYLKLKEMD